MTENLCDHWLSDGTLERWVENDIEGPLYSEVALHLETCPACRVEIEALKIESSLLRESMFSGVHNDTSDVTQPIERGFSTPLKSSRKKRGASFHASWIAIAASMALILGIFYYRDQGSPNESLSVSTRPALHLVSVDARPGEQVTIDLKVSNLEGLSGLKAEVVFDPNYITVVPRQNSLAQCGVQEDRVIIATLSQDAWKQDGGVAFRLPVTVRENTPPDIKIDLRIEGVELSDSRQLLLNPHCRNGVIKVL